jgi:hypothetical protein
MVVKPAGGLLQSLPSAQMQGQKPRENMCASQGSSPCPGCAVQAVLTVALCREIARLHAEVKRLRAQLAQTSANSLKPLSSDPPTRAWAKVRELSTRQQGGQPGVTAQPSAISFALLPE